MLLTKHEGETFHNQTVYISGQAFIRCNFVACTLVLRETIFHWDQCSFVRCNWHIDYVLLWGSPESLRDIKALVTLIEQAQRQQQQMAAQQTSGDEESQRETRGEDAAAGDEEKEADTQPRQSPFA